MSDSERIGLGIIGCGGDFARFTVQTYARLPQVRLAGGADVRKQAAEEFSAQFNVPAYTEARDLIARSDVHVVHIATPPASHHELAMLALQAGKHVLCEKPLAMNTGQADEMLAAAAEARRILAVNFVLRYNAVTEAVKAIIDSAAMGRVLSARFTNCAGDSKLGPSHWFWDKSVSGGIFIEHAVHFFDLYRYWLGEGTVLSAAAMTREDTGQEDRVTCLSMHPRQTPLSQYHGFDQVGQMDRSDHRLVMETGDLRVEGWIPLTLRIDALADEQQAETLADCCPGCSMEFVQEFPPQQSLMTGRGRQRRFKGRLNLEYTPQRDKQTAYADGVRDLLADQLAAVAQPGHRRRVTESNGRAAVAMAQAAAELAARVPQP